MRARPNSPYALSQEVVASGRAPPPLYAADLELATPAAIAAADGAAVDGAAADGGAPLFRPRWGPWGPRAAAAEAALAAAAAAQAGPRPLVVRNPATPAPSGTVGDYVGDVHDHIARGVIMLALIPRAPLPLPPPPPPPLPPPSSPPPRPAAEGAEGAGHISREAIELSVLRSERIELSIAAASSPVAEPAPSEGEAEGRGAATEPDRPQGERCSESYVV